MVTATARVNQIWIAAERISSPGPDLCALAGAATEQAVTVLNRGPVPRRQAFFPAHSLARIDACELLDAAALAVVPGIDVTDPRPEFSNWGCRWRSIVADAGTDLDFSRDNDLGDDGRPTRLGGGKAYIEPEGEGDDTCVVHLEHRACTDAEGEATVEVVMLTAYGPQPPDDLCATAKSLATAVARRLPKP
ncbi:hypothetical protein [Streptomyces sp. NPDC058335]|uniref:hypothetical protein n=1 Tax=Streptomyces sp. NPDC058335 TaxID=3346451 RepID=UPI00365D2987